MHGAMRNIVNLIVSRWGIIKKIIIKQNITAFTSQSCCEDEMSYYI